MDLTVQIKVGFPKYTLLFETEKQKLTGNHKPKNIESKGPKKRIRTNKMRSKRREKLFALMVKLNIKELQLLIQEFTTLIRYITLSTRILFNTSILDILHT